MPDDSISDEGKNAEVHHDVALLLGCVRAPFYSQSARLSFKRVLCCAERLLCLLVLSRCITFLGHEVWGMYADDDG